MSDLGDLYGGEVILAADDGMGGFVIMVRRSDDFYQAHLAVADGRDESYVAATVTQTHRLDVRLATPSRV